MVSGLFFNPPSAAASLVKQDTTTQGSWIGSYGTLGYNIIGNTSSYPAYAIVQPQGVSTNTWTTATTDPRALQTADGSGRQASDWYSPTSFSIGVDLTDDQPQDIALYALDWDNQGRSEQIQISNASTGAVLDTETLSNFSQGVYLQWRVFGNVVITVTNLAGPSAVLSGLFIDPLSESPANTIATTANFTKLDSTTSGNWIGKYGSQGYTVVDGTPSTKFTSDAEIQTFGASTYVWASSTTNTTALQNPNGTGRVAAAWYGGNYSFSIDVDLMDGQAHSITLYALDYLQSSRTENFEVTNAVTGAVLDSRTISNFGGGDYLQWVVSGNVVITVSALNGPNAVVNGLFIDPASAVTIPPPATAAFIRQDATTQGNWIGVYGSQGYDVVGSGVSNPTYTTVTPAGQSLYTWATPSSSATQALEVPPAGTSRVAAVWYSSTSFTVDVNVASGQSYNLELYFLDYDAKGRAETVTLSDANTSATLNSQSVSNFANGDYLAWTISGNVLITFTCTAGTNAVLSGLFFDPVGPPPPPPPPAATASFRGSDTATRGNWIGVYGSQGYDVVGSGVSNPTYTTVTPAGQSLYTWATPSSSATQALRGPSRGHEPGRRSLVFEHELHG